VVVSIRCPPGTYTDQASRVCVPCPAGFVSDSFSHALSCQPCPDNYYQPESGLPPSPSLPSPFFLLPLSAFPYDNLHPFLGRTNCSACPLGFFQDGSNTTTCLDCATRNYDRDLGCPAAPLQNLTSSFSQPSSVVLIILACILIILCIFVLILFCVNRATPIVKSASPVFCSLILLGLMFGGFFVFLLVGTPTPGICIARPFLVSAALAFVLGNLFIKTWRIFQIFG